MTPQDIKKRIALVKKSIKNKNKIKKRVSKALKKHAPLFKSLSKK